MPFALKVRRSYVTETLQLTCNLLYSLKDYAFGLYSEDLFVQSLMELYTKYPGAGTHFPAQNVAEEYGGAYFVPKTTPLPPQGNPELRGIVAGQLWDPATP